MQIPTFLLRKLYVKGSLENVDDGFTFKIKNSLSPGTAIGMEPVRVNDEEYPLSATSVTSDGETITADAISEENSFPIKVGVEIIVHVAGGPLGEGEHKIDISLKTKEAGVLAFDVKDSI